MKVADFQKRHDTITPIYEKLGLFHVYSSVWFSAIYILLFVSLIGCIVPRTWQFVGQLRGQPPAAPRPPDPAARLHDLAYRRRARAGHARPRSPCSRSAASAPGSAADAVAAEKGYLREAGNLIFHVSLIVILVAFATGQLFKSEGGKLIVQGDGFSNTLTQYDDFKSGSLFDSRGPGAVQLHPGPLRRDVRALGARTRHGPRVQGARHLLRGRRAASRSRRPSRSTSPLVVDGSKVYLLSHGYAPSVTVKDGKGDVVFHGAVPLLPMDNNLTSSGAIKVLDGYRDAQGNKDQLGLRRVLRADVRRQGHRRHPDVLASSPRPTSRCSTSAPTTATSASTRVCRKNVYQLDTASRSIKPFKDANGTILKKLLLPGESLQLPDGAGSITFDKGPIKQWASFQITHQPGQRSRPHRRDRCHRGARRLAVHPAAPGLGPGRQGRRRGDRRRDGRARPQ